MNVVIDTNVIVSALLNPFGQPAEVLKLFLTGDIKLLYDQRILSEYNDVLKRPKFKFNTENIEILLDEIQLLGQSVLSIPLKEALPDINDNMFLEVALSGKSNFIITGNLVHFPPERCEGVKVLSPGDFIKHYIKNIE